MWILPGYKASAQKLFSTTKKLLEKYLEIIGVLPGINMNISWKLWKYLLPGNYWNNTWKLLDYYIKLWILPGHNASTTWKLLELLENHFNTTWKCKFHQVLDTRTILEWNSFFIDEFSDIRIPGEICTQFSQVKSREF